MLKCTKLTMNQLSVCILLRPGPRPARRHHPVAPGRVRRRAHVRPRRGGRAAARPRRRPRPGPPRPRPGRVTAPPPVDGPVSAGAVVLRERAGFQSNAQAGGARSTGNLRARGDARGRSEMLAEEQRNQRPAGRRRRASRRSRREGRKNAMSRISAATNSWGSGPSHSI